MMPEIDGYQVIDYVRKGCHNDEFAVDAKNQAEFPIIILSAMNFSDDIQKGCRYIQPIPYQTSHHGATLCCRDTATHPKGRSRKR